MTANDARTALVLALLLLVARGAAAEGDFYWSGAATRGKTVEIRNINGDIHAEPARDGKLEVTAIRTSKKDDPESVRIEFTQVGDHLMFCALYPTKDGYPANTCDAKGRSHSHSDNNDVTVQFRVKVPAGVTLEAHTVNGGIEALRLSGPIDAQTVNGEVKLSTTSYAEASTVNGSLEVAMDGRGWPDGLAFRTVNGDIRLDVTDAVNADLRAETMNGDIASDFPLTVLGRMKRNKVRATIGHGGTELALATLNGSIELRRAAR
jgi:DUF4097 and DUF4098 domain-containing protein YvlB